jgi:DNA topoisomerase IA
VSRVNELIAIATIASHCTDPKCQKCSARIRWSRRKAWRASKSQVRKPSERK